MDESIVCSLASNSVLYIPIFSAAMTRYWLAVEPVVSVGINVELDELIELAWEDLVGLSELQRPDFIPTAT